MGDIRINVRSAVTIGLLGFAGVWLVNRVLSYMGQDAWKA